MKIRIKDIAKRLNISESTVSRALADHPRISESTRKKVILTAKKLNYRPNLVAKSLKLKSTKTIGLIICDITNPFYPDIVKSIENQANKNDFNIILCNSDYKPEKEIRYLNILIGKRVDGMIITPTGKVPLLKKTLDQNAVPFVLIDIKPSLRNRVNCVYADQEFGAYLAVKHLINQGHSKIALVNGPKNNSPCLQVEYGYRKAMDERNITIKKNFMKECNLKSDGGFEATKELLDKPKEEIPTAIIYISDTTAIGGYEALKEKGLKIPEEISIVGYDDIPEAKHFYPPLTTIAQPKRELGEKGISLLMEILRKKNVNKIQTIRLLPQLIVRESTATLEDNNRAYI
jgi:LacI family transcriptional regulator